MKVAIVCVCYNAYDHLLRFAASLKESFDQSAGIEFTFVVVDNSTKEANQKVLADISGMGFNTHYLKSENVGYFPGFKKGAELLGSLSEFDCVAISNVDLTVRADFFKSLKAQIATVSEQVGIIAPAILSKERGGDLNPKTLFRPTRYSLLKNIFIFKRLWLFKIYRKLSDLKVKSAIGTVAPGEFFYSPHGSFILFTNRYFVQGGSVDYPQFLFGEEDFVAEQCLRIGLKVQYQPSIAIVDDDHGSTSREKLEFIASEHVKSLKYIVDTYHS
ncbi:glycosyltransferase [Pseudomonas sp. PMCC200344]|uniref:glycosyltransferase family 2 protein n=1 Tax=Pseudomonas sp. PMCC200344 TaxID=3042028 RepID=UPI0024B3C098|nr:glycosyltransferase [Pseudomonas sp. PMCC200344]